MYLLVKGVWAASQHEIGGNQVSSKIFWRPGKMVASMQCITNGRSGSILGRPLVSTSTWAEVARILITANNESDGAFGIGYEPKYNTEYKLATSCTL